MGTIEKLKRKDGCHLAWATELAIAITEEEWGAILKENYRITNYLTLRYFQYKVLNRILTTNVKVAKWNKEISPLCTFCQQAQETVIHILIKCKHISKLWENLRKWIKYFLNIELKLTPEPVIFNRYKGNQQ